MARIPSIHDEADGIPGKKMPLRTALHILTQSHTRDDADVGFTVEWSPRIEDWSRGDYIEAWRVVRDHLMTVPNEEGAGEPEFP